LTFKELKKIVSINQNLQQQNKFFEKLRTKLFWIWNSEEYRQEDISTSGDCCFNHVIGLPQKNSVDKPLYDYEKIIGLMVAAAAEEEMVEEALVAAAAEEVNIITIIIAIVAVVVVVQTITSRLQGPQRQLPVQLKVQVFHSKRFLRYPQVSRVL
jgi:hypothetical protein